MMASARLSLPAAAVWAKSSQDSGTVIGWLPLWRHLDDTAAIAGKLWDEWLPVSVRRVIASRLPGGVSDGRRLVRWLAGVHDVGKATPAFAVQVPLLADRMRERGLDMPRDAKQLADRRSVPHALAGHVILTRWLGERHGWSPDRSQPFAVVVGGHHGVPPDAAQLDMTRRRVDLLGDGLWRRVQDEYLDRAQRELDVSDGFDAWRSVDVPPPAQVLLTAVVIVADWIASNNELFPHEVGGDQQHRLTQAWASLDLPSPWHAGGGDVLGHFAERFGLSPDVRARPVQIAAAELARRTKEPGLLIIEAPMGEGKTEAALLAAEAFASRTGAGGCFIALPTQATTNAMFDRARTWLDRLPDATGGLGRYSVFLAHGKASLNDNFRGLMWQGRVRDVGGDETALKRSSAELVAHQWLAGRKKGVLSSFVVGTIDQLLFAGLKSRHLALRHLSIASKIVIVDEAHAYDVYMSTYLDRVLEWLGAYAVPTIVLSATLPAARRRDMVVAYEKGRAAREPADPSARRSLRGAAPALAADLGLADDIGYPVLVASTGTATPVVRVIEGSGRGTVVRIESAGDDLELLASTLRDALIDAGCAVVIRNTVKRVQETARYLQRVLHATAVIVAHSRFLAVDRARNDDELLRLFGPNGSARRRDERYVVVASQVVEQSLDVDFDLLVTDLAPVDLLLQRIGRLHRHQRGDRQSERAPALRSARCLITGVDWASSPPEPVSGSRVVYGRHALYRSVAVLEPLLRAGRPLKLPDEIPPLVQRAYGDEPIGPADWRASMARARGQFENESAQRQQKADTFRLGAVGRPGDSLVGWLYAGVGDVDDDPQGVAQVRDGRPGIEALVVQRDEDGGLITPRWLAQRGGESIPVDEQVPWPLARVVAACTLPLPPVMCLPATDTAVISALERNFYPGWQETYLLAGQLVLVLDDARRAHVAGFDLSYDPDYGLEYSRDR